MTKSKPINLFILAAGYGTRMRPLTDLCPKPLLPIGGMAVIEHILEQVLSCVEVGRIGVNSHHQADKVEAWLASSRFAGRVELFFEADILDTGGALKNAATLFETEDGQPRDCLVINGDCFSTMNYGALVRQHQAGDGLGTLAIHRRDHEPRVGLDDGGRMVAVREHGDWEGATQRVGFATAAVYGAAILNYLPTGKSSVVMGWVEAMEAGQRFDTWDIDGDDEGCYWRDIGSLDAYAQANMDYLAGREVDRYLKTPLALPTDLRLHGCVVIEAKVEIGEGVTLEDCIVLPGACIETGANFKNKILGGNAGNAVGPFCMSWKKDQAQTYTCRDAWARCEFLTEYLLEAGRSDNDLLEFQAIGAGGSDRDYFRCFHGSLPTGKVLMHYGLGDEQTGFQLAFTPLFKGQGVNVPDVLAHDGLLRLMIQEDVGVGGVGLDAWLVQHRSLGTQEKMLRQVLDQLLIFQHVDYHKCVLMNSRAMDVDYLRWETSYFVERCVGGVFGLQGSEALDRELDALAQEVAGLDRVVMHRDFQSQNVMIVGEGEDASPCFIDFQGARPGPPWYDAVSLLRDPYTQLDERLSGALMDYYCEGLGHRVEGREGREEQGGAERAIALCGLQRHMQALGAYGFLSRIKGKSEFLKHISPALAHLSAEIGLFTDEFPHLAELIGQLSKRQNKL